MNHTDGFSDGTELTLNFYRENLPMFEKFKTKVYNIATGAYVETFIDKYEEIEKIEHFANGNTETTFRNNTVKLEYETDKIKYTYATNNYTVYQNNIVIEKGEDQNGSGLIYTIDK